MVETNHISDLKDRIRELEGAIQEVLDIMPETFLAKDLPIKEAAAKSARNETLGRVQKILERTKAPWLDVIHQGQKPKERGYYPVVLWADGETGHGYAEWWDLNACFWTGEKWLEPDPYEVAYFLDVKLPPNPFED